MKHIKVKHYARVYPEYDKNPDNYTDIEVNTRTIRLFHTHQYYDRIVLIEDGKTKISKPTNFSKLNKL